MSLGLSFVYFAPEFRSCAFSIASQIPAKLRHTTGIRRLQFCCKAAASSAGAGAEYSEAGQLLGSRGEQRRRRRSIAGIEQDELVDPHVLADPDSCFCEFKGVRIHHKICHGQEEGGGVCVPFPILLLHGFGASVFSWDPVIRLLASLTASKVIAFDRPAFGLTFRSPVPTPHQMDAINPYSISFSVLTTLYFIHSLAAQKAILIGHSAGSLVAVDTYFEAPESVAALILVAPAILAPFVASSWVPKANLMKRGGQNQMVDDATVGQHTPFSSIWNILSSFSTYIAGFIMKVLKAMTNMVKFLYKKALTAILRSAIATMLVRMVIDKFGIAAIRNSWYEPNQITEHVIRGYTKPLRVKDWDRALLEYIIAMLTDSTSESKPPLSQRLTEITCPVLIITGDNDRLVPSWNAERLSRAIPGACLEVIRNCGHLPHEERVEEFVEVVRKFLQRICGAPEDQILQAAA